MFILPSIHASRETLTHIHIPEPTHHTATYACLGQLFSIHFPQLSTFQYGGWNVTAAACAALANFLIAHPLIEDLELCFSHTSTCRISPDVAFGSGTLPNLRRLTAEAFNLNIFLRSGVLSLQKLEHLRTGPGHHKWQEEERVEFREMLHNLETKGGLPELKMLLLLLNKDDAENEHWITGFVKLCPRVKRVLG